MKSEDEELVRARQWSRSAVLCLEPARLPRAGDLIHVFAETFSSLGDPLGHVRISPLDGKSKKFSIQNLSEIEDNTDGYYLSLLPRSEKSRSSSMWRSTAAVNFTLKFRKVIFLGLPLSDNSNWDAVIALWSAVSRLTNPQYGFGFDLRYGLGPDYLASGVQHYSGRYEGEPAGHGDLIFKWAGETQQNPDSDARSGRHIKGFLLDVFPINFLTSSHLSQKIYDTTVGQWIHDRPNTSVVPIGNGSVAWLIAADAIPEIRSALKTNELLIPDYGRNPVLH